MLIDLFVLREGKLMFRWQKKKSNTIWTFVETAVMEENYYGKPIYVIDTNLLKLVKL